MKSISREEAMNFLHNNRVAIHCDSFYDWRYTELFNYDMDYSCYKFHGCVIIKHDNQHLLELEGIQSNKSITFNIHQISDKADICAAWQYVLENEKVDSIERIILYAYTPLPNEIEVFGGFCKFTRKGEQYEDSDVRKMTVKDEVIIKELCEDSRNSNSEAQDFYSWFEYKRRGKLLGIFSDKLVGLVSTDRFEDVGLAQVGDLFVHKNYRRLGYGRRLVKAALALYPDVEYFYQAFKSNNASIELALSLGFEFIGAELCVLD